MKKTFKKQIILLAVIAVMMMLAFVMPASAEGEAQIPCPGASGGGHLEYYLKDIVIDPTCTQRGYSKQICTYCNDAVVVEAYKFTEPTGHNYVASYVDKGDHYERIRTCQNDMCQRGGNDITDGNKPKDEIAKPNGVETAVYADGENKGKVIKYYRVEYLNTYESPDRDADNHADSFLESCYVAKDSSTWVLNCTHDDGDQSTVYAPKAYATGKKATLDHLAAAPAYEYVAETEGLALYVQENADAPEYTGDTPKRGKNLTYGKYTFAGWEAPVIEGNKRVYKAAFTPDPNYTVSVSFYNYNGAKLSENTAIPYGRTTKYEDLTTPVRNSDQYKDYKFVGWTFGKGASAPLATDSLSGEITAYFTTGIYAKFEETARTYTLEFMVYDKVIDDTKAEIAVTAAGVKCGDKIRDKLSGIDSSRLEIAKDKKYIYELNNKEWAVKKVNGETVLSDVTVKLDGFDLPEMVVVKDKDTGTRKEVFFGKNDTNVITIAPTYNKYYVNYNFKVSIKPTHFLDEDVYSDNNYLKTDILDKFIIQVTDENGQFIAAGTTDKNGEFWFEAPYRDTLTITASMSNRKYYGEFDLNLKACTTKEEVQKIVDNGIFIYPKVTEEWTEGLKSCSCICHSILSSIVVRIYNVLYRLFNIKYVCCDDLFVVHGNVLLYTK